MCLEAQDPNPHKIEAGIYNVCVRDDSLTNLLSLLSARMSCAGYVSILFCVNGILSSRGTMSKKATVIVHHWDCNDLLTEQRPDVHVQRGGPLDWKDRA